MSGCLWIMCMWVSVHVDVFELGECEYLGGV